jgi:type IX secretion system PorP/SprF family membrane protein
MKAWLRPKCTLHWHHKLKKGQVLLLFSLVFLFGNSTYAQDFHYSQFFNSPLHLNPGLTGIYNGDIRYMGNYRSQWTSVPTNYQTFTVAVDAKFIRKTFRKGFFSGGMEINYDQAGLSRLRLIDLNLSGSYTATFSEHFLMTLGAAGRIGQRSFDLANLSFDQQYDELYGQYNPNLPINEIFDQTSHFFPDLSTGINFRFQDIDASALVNRLDKRSKLDIGMGVFHLLRPDQSFIGTQKSQLPMRLSPYLMGTLMLGKDIDFILNGTAQFQGSIREIVGLAGLKLHLNRQLGKQFALQLDFGYRYASEFGDAMIPGIEFFFNGWQAGFTYDINISDFNVATSKKGGPEISLRYIFRKVRPLPIFKICPLI